MTPTDLELRRLAEMATSGPWTSSEAPSNTGAVLVFTSDGWPVADISVVWNRDPSLLLADAAFIAAAHPGTVLRLLARIERMEAVVEAAGAFKPKLDSLRTAFPPPDSWLADATCANRVEFTVSQWNKMEALRKAIDTYRATEAP